MENQSAFDPTRKTVGATYLEAAYKNKDKFVEAGDLSRELAKSLVDDLNDTIKKKPYGDRAFYITVWERKDLQMKKAIKRSLYTTLYRPWPEDDTVVYYIDPKKGIAEFCWCLPHHTDMPNVINNSEQYPKDYVEDVRAWKNFNLGHFGFHFMKEGAWAVTDKEIEDPESTHTRMEYKEGWTNFEVDRMVEKIGLA